MKKLKLDLNELRVASFETSREDEAARGTVHARGPMHGAALAGAITWVEVTCNVPSCYVACRTRYDTPCV